MLDGLVVGALEVALDQAQVAAGGVEAKISSVATPGASCQGFFNTDSPSRSARHL